MAKLHPNTVKPEGQAVVVLLQGDSGLHSGLVYQIDDEPRRLLHLAWHHALQDEALSSGVPWVVSGLRRTQAEAVATMAAKIAQRYSDGAVDYGFSVQGIGIRDDGTVMLDGGVGLTCASFIHFVFDGVSLTPIRIDTYDALPEDRKLADKKAQKRLAKRLRKDKKYESHAQRVTQEIGFPRVRPEDIAGASSLGERPVDFVLADEIGADLTRQFDELKGL